MRLSHSMIVVVPFLAACGGAGMGTSHEPAAGVRTTGVVLSIDGRTVDLSQVTVGAPHAGVWVSCDAAGHFDLGQLPPEAMTLLVEPGDRPAIELPADLRNCTTVDIALTIDGDHISRMDLEHCGASHGMQTRGSMRGMDGMGGMDGEMDLGHMPGADGVAMHEDDAGHMGMALEIAGFDAGATVEVVLVNGDGMSATLGVYVADAAGVVRATWDAFGGGALPFGVSHMHDLAGMTLEVRDAVTGELLFTGTLPEMGFPHGGC